MIDTSLGDPGWLLTYVDLADRILAGTHPQIADVSPTYLGLMIALRFLGASAPFIRTLQLLMLVVAAVFCALAAKRIGGRIAAIATAALILGNRAAWIVCAELDPKALIFLLTSIALWALLRRSYVLAGVALGLAAATHPYGYILLLLSVVWTQMAEGRGQKLRPLRSAICRLPSAKVAIAALIPILLILLFSPIRSHTSTQFYEGNNALATGCAGVTPRAITELQAQRRDASPDTAYRILAGNDKTYWRDQALTFIREHPGVALQRFATKALLTIHHFDVHDIITAQRRNARLSRFPAIGFGLAFVLAVAAMLSPKRRELLLPALFAVAMIVLLTIFVVSARQRNVLLAPLAILGGVGVAQIVALARARIEHGLLAFGAAIITTALLGIETAPMREYAHTWRIALHQPVDPSSPAHQFDRAVVLEHLGRWAEADAILAALDDYRPMRQAAAVSSVSYYRARAALALGRDPAPFIERALREAPGDPDVLALRAIVPSPRAQTRGEGGASAPGEVRHAFGTTAPGGKSGAGR